MNNVQKLSQSTVVFIPNRFLMTFNRQLTRESKMVYYFIKTWYKFDLLAERIVKPKVNMCHLNEIGLSLIRIEIREFQYNKKNHRPCDGRDKHL